MDTNDKNLPYNSIIQQIVNHKNRTIKGVIKCESIYFSLIPGLAKQHSSSPDDELKEERVDQRMRYLVSLLKGLLVDNGENVVSNSADYYFIELAKMLAYDAQSDFRFKKHLQPLFEDIIAIFLNPKQPAFYEILASMSSIIMDGLKESKKMKEHIDLQLFMMTSVNAFLAQIHVQIIEAKQHRSARDPSLEGIDDKQQAKFSSSLFEVVALFLEPVLKHGKDKSLIKPCLDLFQTILSVNIQLDYKTLHAMRLCKEMLDKNSLCNLKDNSTQATSILDKLIDTAFEFPSYSKLENKSKRFKDFRDQTSLTEKLLSEYADRLKAFPKLLDQCQSVLFSRLICDSIAKQINDEEFFRVVTGLMKVVKLDKHAIAPNDQLAKERLRNVYRLATSSAVFDSIQSDCMKFYQNPAGFYLQFYRIVSAAVKERDDVYRLLEDDLIAFVCRCAGKNDLLDEQDSNSMTINYMILLDLSMNLFKKENVHDKLINTLIDAWFDLYEEKKYSQEAKSMFNNCCSLAKGFYRKNLARKAEFLWTELLNTTYNEQMMLNSYIIDIIQYSQDVFLEKFSSDFFRFIYEADDNTLSQTSMVMSELARVAPEFYFSKEGDSDQMVIFQLILQSNQRSDDKFFSRASPILEHLFTQLEKDKALFDKYNDELFKGRQILFEMLPLENGQNNVSYENIRRITLSITLVFVRKFDFLMVRNHDQTKVRVERARRVIEDDFFFLCRKLSMAVECSILIQGVKELALHIYQQDKRINLLLANYEKFKGLKHDFESKLTTNQKEELDQIIYLCEGRTIEAITSKLEENVATINSLNQTVADSTQKLSKLDSNLKDYETTFTGLNENMNEITKKLVTVDTKLDEQEKQIGQIDEKTLLNVPTWCKKLIKLLESKYEHAADGQQQDEQSFKWMILISKRLNFGDLDIKSWLQQPDPYLSMFQEWYTINKTSDATNGLLKLFRELNLTDCVKLIEESLNELNERTKALKIDSDAKDDSTGKAQVFLCFEWSCLDKAKLLNKYLLDNNLNTWFEDDDGKLGGGANRFSRIDVGLRKCNVLVCFVTNELAKDSNCLGQINLAVQLNKPIIPLLVDSNCKWPPVGTLGPILSEYLFIRFFQRKTELTNDERYWPIDKFNELVMQLKQIIPPSDYNLADQASKKIKNETDVFISYQWDKQKEIKVLFNKLTAMGLKCWLDINEMGGGDSLYEKIDSGIRNTSVVVSCVTFKYSLSANCRKEVALTNSVPKPLVPIVLEENLKYPPSGPMAPILGELEFVDFAPNYKAIEARKAAGDGINDPSDIWFGESFEKLMKGIESHMPESTVHRVTSKACVIS